MVIPKPIGPADNVLTELPAHLFKALFITSRVVTVAEGQMLFSVNDAGDGCYLIDDGLLKATMISASGTERILAILGPGAVVGELSVIDGEPRSSSVYAVHNSALRFVGRGEFLAFGQRQPELYRHIAALLSKRLRETNLLVASASFLPLKGRVARAFLLLTKAFGRDVRSGRIVIHQKLSQSDIAAMTGVARENVSRIINDWKRDGAISRVSSYYCVENSALLENEATL